MKFPWKKNFLKLPDTITNRLKLLDSEMLVVGVVKRIQKDDIKSGLYRHLQITAEKDNISYVESVLPYYRVGRYSNYNVNGRTIIRKDLPEVNKKYSADVPNFGDWSKGSHEMTWDRLVYQKEHWLPQDLNILVELLEEDEESVVFKFELDINISKRDEEIEIQLLFHCNLLQENCGDCNLFPAHSSNADYIATLYVSWELLPPGNLENNINFLVEKTGNRSSEFREKVMDRMQFFESLNPKNYISGSNRFSQYFGALFSDTLVLLENVRYGNAIYIFYEDWQSLSKLSRTEILSGNYRFARVRHHGNWKRRVLNELRDRI